MAEAQKDLEYLADSHGECVLVILYERYCFKQRFRYCIIIISQSTTATKGVAGTLM